MEAVAAGAEAAEEAPATGDCLEGNVGEDQGDMCAVSVALDVLVGLTGYYAADGGGAVGDGGGGGGAEGVDGDYGENGGKG